jgi:menaquinone-specific isochorismate synthase
LFAGCGIVSGSDPIAELAETQAKLAAFQAALED